MENLARWQDFSSAHCLERLEPRVVLDIESGYIPDFVDGVENYYWTDTDTNTYELWDYKIDGVDYTETVDGTVTYQYWDRYLADTTDGYENWVTWDNEGNYTFYDYDATGFTEYYGTSTDAYWYDAHWYADTSDGFENFAASDYSGYWEFFDFDSGGYDYSSDVSPVPVFYSESALDNWYADTSDGFANFFVTDGAADPSWIWIDSDGRDAYYGYAEWDFYNVTGDTTVAHWQGVDFWSIEGYEADHTDGIENYSFMNSYGESYYTNYDMTGYTEQWTSNGVSGTDDFHWVPDTTDGFENESWHDSFGNYEFWDYDATGYDMSESYGGVAWWEGGHEYANTDTTSYDSIYYDPYGYDYWDYFASGSSGDDGYMHVEGSSDGSVYWETGQWFEDSSDGYDNWGWTNSYGDFDYTDYDSTGYFEYYGGPGYFYMYDYHP